MEVRIKGNYYAFKARYRRFFLNWTGWLAIGFVFTALFYGIENAVLPNLLLFLSGALYCIIAARKTLYRLVFCSNSRTVSIEIIVFNSVKYHRSITLDHLNVYVRKNFLRRYPSWVLKIYQQNKIVFRQEETLGWSYEDFLEIEQLAKSFK